MKTNRLGVIISMLLFFGHSAQAQDIIVTKDSSVIRAVVLEINDANIVYKRFDDQEGPQYRINLDKVQKVRYQSGREEVFEEPSLLLTPKTGKDTTVGSENEGAISASTKEDKKYRQRFARLGAGLSQAIMVLDEIGYDIKESTDYVFSMDIVDDNRIVYPGGFLLSYQIGLGKRGFSTFDDKKLSTNNVFGAFRPGCSIRLSSNTTRLDLMAGVHLSYDLFGTYKKPDGTYRISQVSDYQRFDYGLNAGISFVWGKIELYGEWRRGFLSISTEEGVNLYSNSICMGLGWSF